MQDVFLWPWFDEPYQHTIIVLQSARKQIIIIFQIKKKSAVQCIITIFFFWDKPFLITWKQNECIFSHVVVVLTLAE